MKKRLITGLAALLTAAPTQSAAPKQAYSEPNNYITYQTRQRENDFNSKELVLVGLASLLIYRELKGPRIKQQHL